MAMPDGGSDRISLSSQPVSVAVNEHVAARRLGLSVDTLRRDRRLGHLGIPFIKLGAGKHGVVRYDLADLDGFLEGKKRQTPPQAPQPPVHEPPVEQPEPAAARYEPPVEPRRDQEPGTIEQPRPRRSSPPRTMWETLAETALAEPKEDPFAAAGRSAPRRQGSGYWGH